MIRRAVHAVRKAVAHAIAFFAGALDREAKRTRAAADRLASFAGRVAPEPMPVLFAPVARNIDAPTFTVLRWVGRRYWTLYAGKDGARARRLFEAVEKAGEPGRMEFQMTEPKAPGGYVVRAVYEPIRG